MKFHLVQRHSSIISSFMCRLLLAQTGRPLAKGKGTAHLFSRRAVFDVMSMAGRVPAMPMDCLKVFPQHLFSFFWVHPNFEDSMQGQKSGQF